MTTNNAIVDSKEQYLALRAVWKDLYATGYHNAVESKVGITYNKETKTWTDVIRAESPLTGLHHLAYAIARGRTPPPGFITAKREKFGAKYASRLWVYENRPEALAHTFKVFGDVLREDQKTALAAAVRKFLAAYK